MFININTYYTVVIVLAAMIVAVPLFSRYVLRRGGKLDFAYFFLLVLLPVNWFTPAVYTVTGCGEYAKEVLILPATRDGERFDLGWHNYFINRSDAPLTLEDVVYGSVSPGDVTPDVIILPGQTHKAPFVKLDYIFETPPTTERTKGSGTIKRLLSCR